jgi:hypothetical protein
MASSIINDTSPEAEAVLLKLLCDAPVWRKMELMEQLNQTAINLMMSDIRQQFEGEDNAFLRRKAAERILGREMARLLWE